MGAKRIGIDAGGTLIKIACVQNDKIGLEKFPSNEMEAAAAWVKERYRNAKMCVTGGKAALFQSFLGQDVSHLPEFEATCSGVRFLLEREGLDRPTFLLTNVGTGTSIHFVDEEHHRRIGGSGVGGGTLLGLSALLTGRHRYEDIVELAGRGTRDAIDLRVSHIYEGAVPPIPGELTASNFGRLLHTQGPYKTEDVLASVVGLVGETVATVSVHAAGQCGISHIIYIGSSFIRNPSLQEIVFGYTKLRGASCMVLRNGEFSGALGAAASLIDRRASS